MKIRSLMVLAIYLREGPTLKSETDANDYSEIPTVMIIGDLYDSIVEKI